MRLGVHNVDHATLPAITKCEVAAVDLTAADCARFWAKVEIREADACWLWQSNLADAKARGRLSLPKRRNRGIKPTVIARYLDGGISAADLGAEYGVCQLTVLRWVRGANGGSDLRKHALRLRKRKAA